jgi:cystathionine beta-lyase
MTFDEIERLTIEQLRAIGNSKWVTFPDAIGSFIAESDYGTAPAVLETVQRRVTDASFGYSTLAERAEVGQALARFTADRYDWVIDPAQVGVLPEVLTSLELTLEHFAEPGPVVVPTPAYMPFFQVLRDHGREIIEVPLVRSSATWVLDTEAIERAFVGGAKLLLLVNPANPTGTVFGRDELLPIVDIVDRHGGRVWADEIHAPIVFDGKQHVPYASLSNAAAAHTVTATSASKGWNIAGLKTSQVVFTNPDDARRWRDVGRWPAHTTASLGILATIAAYDQGRDWLDQLVTHLQGNRDLLTRLVADLLPRARLVPAEATYLAWLDLREYGVSGSLQSYLLREAGVAGTDGLHCGRDFAGYYRLNFATPRAILTETVERIARALPRAA